MPIEEFIDHIISDYENKGKFLSLNYPSYLKQEVRGKLKFKKFLKRMGISKTYPFKEFENEVDKRLDKIEARIERLEETMFKILSLR